MEITTGRCRFRAAAGTLVDGLPAPPVDTLSSMSPPLAGVRVLDFTRILAGPFATMTLADLGADVVKVESPRGGDDTRRFGPPFQHGVSTYFLAINRGKRSISLDLRTPEGQARARALAAAADVVMENFRPGVMADLGLDYETLARDRPDLVYLSLSGFGQDDPRRGYDIVAQGMSGIPALTGPVDGGAWKCGASIADLTAGMNAVQAVLAALFRRERTGEGAFIDLSLVDGQRALLVYHASSWLNAGVAPPRPGNRHPSIHPFGIYRAADAPFTLAIGNDRLWRALCTALDRPDWGTDPRLATMRARVDGADEVDALLEPAFAARPVTALLAALEAAGVPAGPVWTVPETLADAPLVAHPHPEDPDATVRSVPLPWTMSAAERAAPRGAPRLGEHADEVLADWLGDAP